MTDRSVLVLTQNGNESYAVDARWESRLLSAARSPASSRSPRRRRRRARAEAPTVVGVEVRSDAPVDTREVGALLAIRVGEPLDEESVRRTLLRLRLAGLASEIEVLTRPAPGGVVAVVVLHADVQVEAVELAGELGVDEKTLRAALPQRSGQPLREDRVLRGVYKLEEALAAQGWIDGRATLAVQVDPATRRARVTYRIEPGPRWTVGEVRLEGLDGGPLEAKVRAALRAGPGAPYRAQSVRSEEDRLQRFLVRDSRTGWPTARIPFRRCTWPRRAVRPGGRRRRHRAAPIRAEAASRLRRPPRRSPRLEARPPMATV